MAIGLVSFTVYGGFIMNIIVSVVTANRPNAEEMNNTNQDQRQAAWGLVLLVVGFGCATGCFYCFWSGLKNKNTSLLRIYGVYALFCSLRCYLHIVFRRR